MTKLSTAARYTPWLVWLPAAIALTLIMWLLRDQLDKAHVALLYLLPVLGGAAHGGRRLGLVLAALTFVAFIWREKLFAAMSNNARSAASFFRLPPNQVVELGAQVEL